MNNNFTLNNESCQFSQKACRRNSAHMLPVTDWLSDLPENTRETDLVEIQFKNTRKGYYRNTSLLPLEKGAKVIVEANPGYDLGEVVLTGRLVLLQMNKNHIDTTRYEIRSVLRFATEEDMERAAEAHAKEQDTMIRSRQLAKSLGLEMKIGDVEYQGDGTKAIFYYIADGRVDFRQLIKVYAETFHIRIEMKQIGARQEAGRIGGTGPCGRELCCSTWMTNFSSVGTGAARLQKLSPNPQKLAGQCAKLKCCLNYEVPLYEEARKMGYSLGSTGTEEKEEPEIGYQNVVGQDDLTRFDKKKKNRNANQRGERKDGNRPNRERKDNRPRDNRQHENKNNPAPAQ
jgi:cell fate regulator YaaT (PSP1 superfamily)